MIQKSLDKVKYKGEGENLLCECTRENAFGSSTPTGTPTKARRGPRWPLISKGRRPLPSPTQSRELPFHLGQPAFQELDSARLPHHNNRGPSLLEYPVAP